MSPQLTKRLNYAVKQTRQQRSKTANCSNSNLGAQQQKLLRNFNEPAFLNSTPLVSKHRSHSLIALENWIPGYQSLECPPAIKSSSSFLHLDLLLASSSAAITTTQTF
jgi:hypothetical protein